VARVAGVSAKTVSRVLNGEPGVAEATTARIRSAIAQLGFRRNEMARALRTGGRTRAVGLVIDELDSPHAAGIAGAVARRAREHGYLVITGTTAGDPAIERRLVGWLLGCQVDALLIAPAGDDHRYLSPQLGGGLAVVFVDRPAEGIETDCVVIDNVDGARQATHHLLRHWHRRIAFIGDRPEISSAAERLDGYRQALATGGIWLDPELIRMGVQDVEATHKSVENLLALSNPPTAIVAAGSRLAAGAMRAHERSGIALVGFDDLDLPVLQKAPLTTVSCAPGDIGSSAISLLLARLDGTAKAVQKIVVPAMLTARGSGELRPGVAAPQRTGRRWYRR
jgi:LacI family transcriptional regulator